MKRVDEFSLIRRLTKQSGFTKQDRHIEVGIGDDAAVVSVTDGMRLVTTCDTMVETVHFNQRTMRAEHVGFKALAANVSDIAAMGGIPKYALVSISVPKRYSSSRLEQLYKGLYACAEQYDLAVIGGDTTSSPRHLVISITVFGEVEPGRACLRSSAKPGHAVFVTGVPGEAAAGLHYLLERHATPSADNHDPYQSLLDAHQRPLPSVRAGRILLTTASCGALNDISDGLASELHEISAASGLQIVLDKQRIPCSEAMAKYATEVKMDALEWTLFGGEDYHLVGTTDQAKLTELQESFSEAGIPFYMIGEVSHMKTNESYVSMSNQSGEWLSLEKKGFNHF